MNRDEQIEAGARALHDMEPCTVGWEGHRFGPTNERYRRQAAAVLDALTPPEGVDTAAVRRLATDYLHAPYGVTRQHLAAECIPLALRLCDELDRLRAEGEREQVGWWDGGNLWTEDPRPLPLGDLAYCEPVYVHRPAPTKGETP